ncbi:MAG: hypothetical protein IJ298_09755 [Ruminococcus sp.]|nr:hypothetical protein [Ruminococcus sp.]
MKKIVSVILFVVLCLSLTACGGNNKIEGTWHTYDLGVDIDSPELPEYYSIVFAPDGTGRGPMGALDRLDTVEFTYTAGDDTITVLTDRNEEFIINYTFEGENLILEWGGYTRTCEKFSDEVIIEWH